MTLIAFITVYQTLIVGFTTLLFLIISLLYAKKQLVSMKKDRQSALITNLMNIWESELNKDSQRAIIIITDKEGENSGKTEIKSELLYEKLSEYEENNAKEYLRILRVADFF